MPSRNRQVEIETEEHQEMDREEILVNQEAYKEVPVQPNRRANHGPPHAGPSLNPLRQPNMR